MYRKFKPDNIFTGSEMLTGGEVLIVANNGTIAAIVPEAEAGQDVQELPGILCPGMVNAHCHIELSHMKGLIPEGTGLVEFVKQVIYQRELPRASDAAGSVYHEQYEHFLDEKMQAITDAAKELYETGTVAVGDICNTADSLELKRQSPLYWHNFIEVSGFVDALATRRLAFSEDILATFTKAGQQGSPAGNSLTPHAPYSVSKTLFNLLNEKTAGQIVSVHNQETPDENNLFLSKTGGFLDLYKTLAIPSEGFTATGRSSLQSWMPYFNRGQNIIAVHNTFTSESDVQAAANSHTPHYCICVNANLYIEKALPPLPMLLQNNCRIVLGTDSYASNQQLNMMAEMNTLRKYFNDVPLATMLQWATLNGAVALGIDDRYGSFEKGKQPGLALINEENGTCRRLEF